MSYFWIYILVIYLLIPYLCNYIYVFHDFGVPKIRRAGPSPIPPHLLDPALNNRWLLKLLKHYVINNSWHFKIPRSGCRDVWTSAVKLITQIKLPINTCLACKLSSGWRGRCGRHYDKPACKYFILGVNFRLPNTPDPFAGDECMNIVNCKFANFHMLGF